MFDGFMELWWERVTPLWRERAELVSLLQTRGQGGGGSSGSDSEAGHPLDIIADGEEAVCRLEALQGGLFLYQVIFGLAFADSILTSWQLCQGFALSHPFVPSFFAFDQGLREVRSARSSGAAGHGGSNSPAVNGS